jgi:glycosyltransferase involved in cell wall biosynthesis
VEHGKSGFVANGFEEFAPLLAKWMSQPDLLESMRIEARRRALSIDSWAEIFAGMYAAYERFAPTETAVESILLDNAGKIVNT